MDPKAPCLEVQTCPMTSLPVEILLGILSLLDGKTIVRGFSVCRLWRETIESSTELKYIIELWADGLVSGPACGLSPVQKLEKLYKWRRAWQNLEWTSQTVFPIDGNPRAYELVGGVFAQQNTWPQSDFNVIRLPSVDISAQISRTENIGIQSLDFAMDPTQDLVVFLHKYPDEIGNFDCRTLSTLAPHPLASSPRLSFDLRDENFRRIFLQVADDIVGLLFRTSGESAAPSLRLVLFNWRTGTALVDLAGPQFPPSVSDFALLSPHAYILGCINDSSYHRGRARGMGEIHIYTFDRAHAAHPSHVATLQLPQLHPGRCLERIVAHSGPFCARPIQGTLFSKANDKRICVISLAYDRSEFYTVYVHHRYFEKYLTNDGAPLTIPWDEWGPQHSRMLPGRHLFWLRYVHGERVACPIDPIHPNRVEVLDFGITPSRPGFDLTSVAGPNTISSGGKRVLFKNDVTTSLPYRRISRYLDDHHVLFLIDQDRLIGVNDAVNELMVYAF
ncbi:F-box domain-containing protein [Mycena venus]|uniref:F-box domain-containing protein n=1 Tax=Mycena venus TaxID=2733690 RepID=A0A8H6X3L3_9AGAR|nr:F-box domain-containing protein [Mycena venus]